MDEMKELQEVKTQIELLARKARNLEERLKAPKSLLTKPEPGSRQKYWQLEERLGRGFAAQELEAASQNPDYYSHGNLFQSKELANAYAQAINTFLALRHQPGTVPASQDHLQWGIALQEDFEFVADKGWWNLENKLCFMFPCFKTQEDAANAIKAIGQDALAQMVKTFGHFQAL